MNSVLNLHDGQGSLSGEFNSNYRSNVRKLFKFLITVVHVD